MPFPIALLMVPSAMVAAPALQIPDWLPGSWKGTRDGASIEEHWSRGTSGLMGFFRMERGNTAVFLEAMVLEPEGADQILRIRHFGPGLKTAWEDKDKPVTFRLASANDREARFEGTGPWTGESLHYLRTGDSGLEVTLEKQVDGKPKRSVYKFTRVP